MPSLPRSCRSSSRRRSVSPHPRRPPSLSPTRPSATHPNRKRFGLNVPTNQARIGKFDLEEIYPEDPIYEELGPNARAWRVNLDECEVFDNDMVTEARDGLDLLLVFAGLFSAVLTTFVAQTSQALSNNFPAVSTSLLLEMVTLQRALINGTPINDISSSEMTSGPSGFDIWVNALWFTSLTLSLGTALMAVLVKQWLYQYMSFISGTARDRSLIRFYRFDGLRKWHVLTIIGTLPIVLHVALGLFLLGLVVFLIPLNTLLATIVGFITAVIYTMYTVSNILPIIHTQCPYRTPFSDILNDLMRPIFTLISSVSSSAPAQALHTFFISAIASALRIYKVFSTTISNRRQRQQSWQSYMSPNVTFQTLKEAERIAATGDDVAESIACDALLWLYQMTSNPPTKSIVLQSLGCLSDDVTHRLASMNTDLKKALDDVIHESRYWSIRPGQESRAERVLRAQRHIKEPQYEHESWEADAEAFKPPFHLLAAILYYAPARSVQSRGGESREWDSMDLLSHILQENDAKRYIHLPSPLWQHLMNRLNSERMGETLMLCRLALPALNNVEQTPPPFSGGVPITDAVVSLDHIIRNRYNLPSHVPLRQLCLMNDSIVYKLSSHRTPGTAEEIISALRDIWDRIPSSNVGTPDDSQAVCKHAERCLQEVFIGDWWHGLSDTDILIQCYGSVIEKYHRYRGRDRIPPFELFKKFLEELCWSEVLADKFGARISLFGEVAFHPDATGVHILFCGLRSPLFSPRTRLSLRAAEHVGHLTVAFVKGLARGSEYLTRKCMEYLCVEPDRLFTVCRFLALELEANPPSYYPPSYRTIPGYRFRGTTELTAYLARLVRLDPTHAMWQERTHYLIDIDPWDWPYFSIPQDHEHIEDVRDKMQFALKVLDDFFSSENPSTPPPAELQTGPQTSVDSHAHSEPLSPWRRVRHLVLSSRAFRSMQVPSSQADIELASPLNDRSSQTAPSERLAMEPAPPSSSNASSHATEDDMV